MDKALILIVACLSLAACSSTRTGSLCTAGPIILDAGASDRLTRGEKEQIVTLNESGAEICGWRPARR